MNRSIRMTRSIRIPLIALAAAIVLATTLVPPAHSAVDCANPQGTGEARACEKAAQGATELRRFIERTQSIYLLYFGDFKAAVR
jgi:hypothetical protein